MSEKTYDLTAFQSNLMDWVNQFAISDDIGNFAYKPIKKKDKSKNKTARLYGSTDMVFTLYITNELDAYIESANGDIEDWIRIIQNYQNPKGWFKQGLWNYDNFHFREHSTAFATSALKLLGGKPKYELKFLKNLNSRKKVEKWLKGIEWGLLFWPGSHKGGGIAAYIITTGEIPDENFFEWYFEWLDKEADPEVGFWRRSWLHKIFKNRLTKNELGGSIHFYWIYEFENHPIPFPEKVIDSTLLLQNDLGLWGKNVSYCVDLDAIFCLTRCIKQLGGYRDEDILQAIIKYLDYTVPSLNNKIFLFNKYKNTHKITGCLSAIAEIQKFYPELILTPKPWYQSLDITPWI
ncbi:MAG: hypothetical protein EU551_03070 [Promethearchaeota archaeon]|nr:MAG: hypothetical protein EU551_03070 [Candidatus Lokiarchaeota archaeon]